MKKIPSTIHETDTLEIRTEGEDLHLSIWQGHIMTGGILIHPSDAPTMALEILEAAGLNKITGTEVIPDSFENHMMNAILSLEKAIGARRDAEAAAKEQAELETEALALFNALRAQRLYDAFDSWDEARLATKASWLAVARKAREMRDTK